MTIPRQSRLNQFPLLGYDLPTQVGNGGLSLPPTKQPESSLGSSHMEVNGPASVSGAYPVKPGVPVTEPHKTGKTASVTPRDEVQISSVAKMYDQLNRSPEIRAERLARIKAEIEAGTYDSPERLESALLKLMQEHGITLDD